MAMSLPLLTVLVALQFIFPSEGLVTKKALQFGTTHDDYVKFSTDMSKAEESLTVCSWVKKQLAGKYRSWFNYNTYYSDKAILISDGGGYNYVEGDNNRISFEGYVAVPLNTWTHQCQSWTVTNSGFYGKISTYYNGTLIDDTLTYSTSLYQGGYIILGNHGSSHHREEIFGGQLMKLDVFGKVLSSEEIAELYNAGRCSDIEEKHQEVRFINWESILSQDRTGNVTEVDSGCPAEEEEDKQNSPSIWDILYDEAYFNQPLTAEKLTELKSSLNILGK